MNVKIKKFNLGLFVLTVALASSHQSFSQDLFDDSFLSDPENKSISVSDTKTKATAPVGLDVLKNTVKERDALVEGGEEAVMEIQMDMEMDTVSEAEQDEVVLEVSEKSDPVAAEVKVAETVAEIEQSDEPVLNIAVSETKKTTNKDSGIDLEDKSPSEKVVGSISKEVFQEMADLEKENVLLTLELKREELKNEINSVKAMQRQSLINEIEKRELAARARIEWEYEQEVKALELWEKRQKAELLAKQIEGIVSGKSSEGGAVSGGAAVALVGEESQLPVASEIYFIVEIKGLGSDLVAKVADNEEKKVFFVKKGSFLPTGHEVLQINKDYVKLSMNGRDELLGFAITGSNN